MRSSQQGQTIDLPAGSFNRIYVLATSADGDQKAPFEVGSKSVDLNIQDWSGFIGQSNNRQSVQKDIPVPGQPPRTEHDRCAEMTGIAPGYVSPPTWRRTARVAATWFGENVSYSYSYLFAYAIDLPAGTKTMTLPDNDEIRVFAVSVADESRAVEPVQPLYGGLLHQRPDIRRVGIKPEALKFLKAKGRFVEFGRLARMIARNCNVADFRAWQFSLDTHS